MLLQCFVSINRPKTKEIKMQSRLVFSFSGNPESFEGVEQLRVRVKTVRLHIFQAEQDPSTA